MLTVTAVLHASDPRRLRRRSVTVARGVRVLARVTYGDGPARQIRRSHRDGALGTHRLIYSFEFRPASVRKGAISGVEPQARGRR